VRRRLSTAGALGALLLLVAVPAVARAQPPAISSAVAISLTDVRVYFNQPIDPNSIQPGDFALTMADSDRQVTGATADPGGTSATISSTSPWFNGEAGSVHLTGPGAIAGSSGEPSVSTDLVKVGAAPGDFIPPTVNNMRLSTSRVRCWCGGNKVGVVFSTSQDAFRGFLTIFRGGARVGVRRIIARPGHNTYHWDGRINGRLLNHGTVRLQLRVVDLVGNVTPESQAPSRKLRIG
jgi:hypothetical protein